MRFIFSDTTTMTSVFMNKYTLIKHDKNGIKHIGLDDRRVRVQFLGFAFLAFCVVLSLGAGIGLYLGAMGQESRDSQMQHLKNLVTEAQSNFSNYKDAVQNDINAMTLQIGKLQAQSVRLNALGTRLKDIANIGSEEFDFSTEPGIGGIAAELEGQTNTAEEVYKNLFSLDHTLDKQQQNLSIIANLLNEQSLDSSLKPNNYPLEGGWTSSQYGSRIDPFTGKKSHHPGIDLSGRYEAAITAAADGVVIWAGKRGTYGNMVEIDHGNGFVTRYAHAKEITVELGQKVFTGDKIAIMGKTGRATSEHLHFEVLKNNQRINPLPFINS